MEVSSLDEGEGRSQYAARDLFYLVYEDLRRAAARNLTGEDSAISVSPTSLVHEAFLKLGPDYLVNDSTHLYRVAAKAMRLILIDKGRSRRAEKRGGDRQRKPLDLVDLAANEQVVDPLELDEALSALQAAKPQAAAVVDLRYFAGLPWPEIAERLEISRDQARSLWMYALAKLKLSWSHPSD